MKKLLIGTLTLFSMQIVHADNYYPAKDGSGTYVVPTSSIRQPGDAGNYYRSNDVYFVPSSMDQSSPSKTCETPASLACIYKLTPTVAGCPIASTTINPSGGAGTTIGVIEEGDDATQLSDLAVYSAQFNLPAAVVNQYNGATCTLGTPSGQAAQDEHALDLDMIHAMAPYAVIDEVEAETQICPGGTVCSTVAQMDQAVQCASSLVHAAGGGFVSNSYGGPEYSGETARDSLYQVPGVIFVASSGDYSAPANYPASSPYVIAAGASSILRDKNGNFIGEAAWNTNLNDEQLGEKSGTSGGPSVYEKRPIDQFFVRKVVGTQRGTPDFSFDGDPATGVCVYTTHGGGWIKDGGTSAAAPGLSGILDVSQYKVTPTTMTQTFLFQIYANTIKKYHSSWRDGLSGNNGYPALAGYDFVTGLGTPLGYNGK